MPGDTPSRRSTDIDPVIELFVQEQIAEVRHLLRGEFTAALLGVTTKLTELSTTIATRDLRAAQDMARLEKKLGEIQLYDVVWEKFRTQHRNLMLGLATLFVAFAVPTLIAVFTH